MNILHTHSLPCDCTTSFDMYLDHQAGFLAIGSLTATDCTITDYVIDWYFNEIVDLSTPSFVSGYGSDGDIGFLHPFYAAGSRIYVAAGEWIPRIRYVTIGGVRYYGRDGIDCALPTFITVDPITCATAADGAYSTTITYNAITSNPDNAHQLIEYYLSSDGTTGYVCVKYSGYAVSDEMRVSYVSPVNGTTTLIERWLVGIDNPVGVHLVSDSYGSLYKFNYMWNSNASNQWIKKVYDVTSYDYEVGDHLLFEMIPCYYGVDSDTNWQIELACQPDGYFSSCSWIPNTWNDTDTSTCQIIWDATNCLWRFHAHVQGLPDVTDHWYLYHRLTSVSSASTYSPLAINALGSTEYQMVFTRNWSATHYAALGNWLCKEAAGLITFAKTSSTIVFSFASSTDYNWWKTSLDNALSHASWTNYSVDVQSQDHYKYLQVTGIRIDTTGGVGYGCTGDNYSNGSTITIAYNPDFANGCDVVYDGTAKTITINLYHAIDEYDPTLLPCSIALHDSVTSIIASINSFYHTADYSFTTYASLTSPFYLRYEVWTLGSLSTIDYTMYYTFEQVFGDTCSFSAEWCNTETLSTTALYTFYKCYTRVTIDDEADPPNNFTVYTRINPTTGCLNVGWTCIYKIVAGTVTTC